LKPNHQLQLSGGKNDIYQFVKEIKTTTIVNKNNDPQGGLEINEVPIRYNEWEILESYPS
jgi:hypothetical protein